MQIIKLNATESTNAYLKELMLQQSLEDYTVVVAQEQFAGRGQTGTAWDSEPGKNLTFSVLRLYNDLQTEDQFLINIAVSLAIFTALKQHQIPDLSIKWPNDILSGNFKICGILIENSIKRRSVQASVIGVGLNVNQLKFESLPQASSLKNLLGRTYSLDELLQSIVEEMKITFEKISAKNDFKAQKTYEELLFRKDKPSTFRTQNNDILMGFIRGITPKGKLVIELEDAIFEEFELKEIQLLY